MQSAKRKLKPTLKIQILLHLSVPALDITHSEWFFVLHDEVIS